MSKSTPIAQLPYSPPPPSMSAPTAQMQQPPPTFINDQHRHLVSQAQTAAQNYVLPQSSNHDISPEDDATIQETLQYITGNAPPTAPAPSFSSPPLPPVSVPMSVPTPPYPMDPASYSLPLPPPSCVHAHAHAPGPQGHPSGSKCILPPDMQMAVLGAVLFVVLSCTPIHKYLEKYIAIGHIPGYDVLVKAAFMAGALYLGAYVVKTI